jgi:hypothetical protein
MKVTKLLLGRSNRDSRVVLCIGEGKLMSGWPLESLSNRGGVTSSSQPIISSKRGLHFKTRKRLEKILAVLAKTSGSLPDRPICCHDPSAFLIEGKNQEKIDLDTNPHMEHLLSSHCFHTTRHFGETGCDGQTHRRIFGYYIYLLL